MQGIVELQLAQFAVVYLLLLVVLAIMKRCRISQSKLLVTASIRMTVQLVLAGYILSYIFEDPHPVFTILYLAAMVVFAVWRILSKNPWLPQNFRLTIAGSLAGAGVCMVLFFVGGIVRVDIFDPQYTIPLSGMIIGNAMTGVTLGLKSFHEQLTARKNQVDTLLNLGVAPQLILTPFAASALETALLPTLNSMLGMGIVSLPGMMTGQILSGTLPTTAILYQIAIMITICTVVCLTTFSSLFLGCKTLYNKRGQIMEF